MGYFRPPAAWCLLACLASWGRRADAGRCGLMTRRSTSGTMRASSGCDNGWDEERLTTVGNLLATRLLLQCGRCGSF
jgi:ribosomal protein S27AE